MTHRQRPLIHFTPPRNWINDPNGLVYVNGTYHLFYQHNPHSLDWGHMTWGHASSKDLLTWVHHEHAIPEDEEFASFSGSAIIDYENVSGFGDGTAAPMIAFYTAAKHADISHQQQHIAYSSDNGVTWRKFTGNPVIPCTDRDVRDPKVFWSESANAWIMLLVHAPENRVLFYRSNNLLDWTLASVFGPQGYLGDEWECPDLVELAEPVSGETKWCLFISVGEDAPSLTNSVKYILGDFDGERFIADGGGEDWVDLGPDFYAAQSWSNLPDAGAKAIWTGWMSNRSYCGDVPAFEWRGCLSQPRELSLYRQSDGALRLAQRPVRTLVDHARPVQQLRDLSLSGKFDLTDAMQDGTYLDLSLQFDPTIEGAVIFWLEQAGQSLCELTIDPSEGALRLVRDAAGRVPNAAFREPIESTARVSGDLFNLRLFFDHSALELFSESGCSVLSAIVSPSRTAPISAGLKTKDDTKVLFKEIIIRELVSATQPEPICANG
ncbi:MAG: hypothetical protein Hens3KO_14050 [Henriciella sp.]